MKKVTSVGPPSRLLNEKEVAVLLGVSVRSLQNARYASHKDSPLAAIPYIKIGTGPRASVRFEEREIVSFIEVCRVRRTA